MHGETRRRNDMTTPVMRTILFAALLLPPLAAAQNAIPTQHNEATVAQLQAQMTAGNLTSEQLTQFYITRILALDQNGPGVNAVIELNPDAITIAKQMDALRRRGVVLGPLHGIPVLLKDNIGTGDKMQTSAGSVGLVGRPAVQGSTVGPHGRTVADAAAALSVIQSRTFDGSDPATGGVPLGWQGTGKTRPTNIPTDYTQFVNPNGLNGLQGAKLGVTRVGLGGFDPFVPTPPQVLDAFH